MSRPPCSRLSFFALALTILCAALPARGTEPAPRQPATFPFDAGTVATGWVDGSMSYRILPGSPSTPEGNELALDWRIAWAVVPRLELGIAPSFVSRDYDRSDLGGPSGLADTPVWAKYGVAASENMAASVGGFVSLPTGDEDDFMGSGQLDFGAFVSGGIWTQGTGFVQAHVGFRTTGDFDGPDGHLDGKTSILTGFGGAFMASSGVELFGSFSLETARYEEEDSRVLFSGGARFALSQAWRVQMLAGVGLTDPTPTLSLGFGLVWNP